MAKTKAQEHARFTEFWEDIWRPNMRHTDGRGDARKAFNKHMDMGADPQEIIDGARGFFRFMKDDDRKFVPLVASWLNKEAYVDWAEREREFQAKKAEREARENVVPIRRAELPENHFSRQWERKQASE